MSREENDFRIRPGRVRSTRAPKPKSFIAEVLKAARKAGPATPHSGARSAAAGGSGFGRGRAGFGRARLFDPGRRVVVKARVVRHKGRSFQSAPLSAHFSYLKREGVSRDGEKGVMFDAESDHADDRAFAERCDGDRHHFRFIVSPEDAGEMTDLKAFTRDLAGRMEADLGTKLNWVAVDHWNTDNPHVHLLVRGVVETGADLVIARDYISRSLRSRAEDLVAVELGPRPEHAIRSALEREVDADLDTARRPQEACEIVAGRTRVRKMAHFVVAIFYLLKLRKIFQHDQLYPSDCPRPDRVQRPCESGDFNVATSAIRR